jgi:hypothetical protein
VKKRRANVYKVLELSMMILILRAMVRSLFSVGGDDQLT